MKIVKKKVKDLKLAPYNPRYMPEEEKERLKRSIETFGYVDPIVWNKRTGHVVGGNQRLMVLQEMGMEEVDVVEVDLPLEKEKALNIALNKISGEWDIERLIEILSELADEGLAELTGFDGEELESLIGDAIDDSRTIYTQKVETPVYEPVGEPVEIWELTDTAKYKELLDLIDKAPVSDEEKEFLRLAATRFIEFHYDKIAEYYARTSKEMQEVMEDLALVIVDFDKAIEKGFVKLQGILRQLYEEAKGDA